MAHNTTPRYTVGQRVEVHATDFDTPGFPRVWMPGTVTEIVAHDSGHSDVVVARDNGKPPVWKRVGKRGGSPSLRAV